VQDPPSGDSTRSRADIQRTQAIIEVAKPWGIAVHDHIIVGKDGHASPVNPRQSPGNCDHQEIGFATVCGSLMQAQ
jgi:hypothetical protein